MEISIKLDSIDRKVLSDTGFRQSFDCTIQEYHNTLSSILTNALALYNERKEKNESND